MQTFWKLVETFPAKLIEIVREFGKQAGIDFDRLCEQSAETVRSEETEDMFRDYADSGTYQIRFGEDIRQEYSDELADCAERSGELERLQCNELAMERLEPYFARWAYADYRPETRILKNGNSRTKYVPPTYWKRITLVESGSQYRGTIAKSQNVSAYRFSVEHPTRRNEFGLPILQLVRDDIPTFAAYVPRGYCGNELTFAMTKTNWIYSVERRKIGEMSVKTFIEEKSRKRIENAISNGSEFVSPVSYRVDGSEFVSDCVETFKNVPIVQTSPTVEFDHETATVETYGERRRRLLACRRWRMRKGFGNVTMRTDCGKRIPALNTGNWIASNGRMVSFLRRSDDETKSGTCRYVQTSIRRAWIDLSLKIRPEFNLTYDRLFSNSLYQEFREECEQQIALHHLAVIRGIEKFHAVGHGIQAVAKLFYRRYGWKRQDSELQNDIPIRERRTEAKIEDALILSKMVAERSLNSRNPKQRQLCAALTKGFVTMSEMEKETGMAQSTIRDNLKLLRLLNR